jgi:predicted transcriptional regulator
VPSIRVNFKRTRENNHTVARTVTVGTKVDPETKRRLERLAEARETTPSALLRTQVDTLLAAWDIEE